MDQRIQLLPSALIDQIAAGEVVERPASVVKELTENALDAGASRVEVRVEEGGRKLVRVVDDGQGMGRQDLTLCVVRHATSKIRALDDLQGLSSLGFRGEALPSIAAVSRLTITTRRSQDPSGLRLSMEGPGQPEMSEVGAPAGTDVEVADLFFNTPARRKFLRTPATEMGHVSAWLTHLGLARPDVHLRLTHNGRKVIEAPAVDDLAQRVAALLGREAFEHLHPVEGGDAGIRVSGLISDPAYSRNNTKAIHLFINGRFVRDRLLQYAVMEGYRTVLPERRFPLVVVKLALDPELVDVNVHPQKTEVRFADARRVQRALSAAIAATLSASPWLELGVAGGANPPARTYSLRPAAGGASADADERADRVREALGRYHRGVRSQTGLGFRPAGRAGGASGEEPLAPEVGERADDPRPLHDWQIVGTLWNTYIALLSGDRLIFMDQHAAHERVTFERLRTAADRDGVRSQRLLVPVQVEVEASLSAVAENEAGRLEELGFEIEPFGPGVLSTKAIPALLSQAPVVQLIRDVLDELAETDRMGAWQERRISVLSRMACHGSVRAGQALGEAEIRALLEQVERVDFAGLCPHGRPVLVEFGRREVEHWFHRG